MSRISHSQFLAGTGALIEGVSTAGLGNVSYLYGPAEEVTSRRSLFARDLGTRLEHGVMFRPLDRDVIADVDDAYAGLGMTGGLPLRADALITRTPKLGLFLLIADCQGISLYDPHNQVVALAHCSRRSTQLQLAAKLVEHLRVQYGSRPEDLIAYLGPSIGAEHYVFESTILSQLTGWGSNIKPTSDGRYSVNVRGYNVEQLRLAGLRPKHIEDSGIDTYSSTDFYSHVQSVREELPEGRFAQYIELRQP